MENPADYSPIVFTGTRVAAPPASAMSDELHSTALRRLVRLIIVLSLAASLAVIGIFARRFLRARSQRPQTFTGVITTSPVPQLLVGRTPYLLVGQGQHGANVEALNGQRATLRGTTVERDGARLLEVVAGSVHAAGDAPAISAPTRSFGTFTLTGEIIDSRCSFNPMKPEEKKVHHDCATACIRGGIPPMFIARDARGNTARMLLVGVDGSPINARVLPYVAQPLVVTGEVVQQGQLRVLRADPAKFRRLGHEHFAELPVVDRPSGGA